MPLIDNDERPHEKGSLTDMMPHSRESAFIVPFAKKSIGEIKSLVDTGFIHADEQVNSCSVGATLDMKRGGTHTLPDQGTDSSPPAYLTDSVALEEWARVAPLLRDSGISVLVMRNLLAGYCTAVSRSVRAEKILEEEGIYYSTKSARGSSLKRRHPAAKDAEDGWANVIKLAEQISEHIKDGKNVASGKKRSIKFK